MTKRILHRCNDRESVEHALSKYEGLECDLRLASDGATIYLGHDQTSEAELDLRQLLRMTYGSGKTLALNVKETGLSRAIAAYGHDLEAQDYFLFDVPGVELPRYDMLGLRVYGRFSAFEMQRPVNGGGILIDPFLRGQQRGIFLQAGLNSMLPDVNSGLKIALISNGCHGRFDEPNMTSPAISYLIGKEQEL